MECPDPRIIEASVTIGRPVRTVYSFYRDFNNLPSFLGDVMAVEAIDPSTTRWTIQGPLKIAFHWTIEVTEEVENTLIRYQTVAHPTRRIRWDIHFAPGPDTGETVVREAMHTPLGPTGLKLLAWIGKPAVKEMTANLRRLKEVLETGQVRDRSYAVPGKFPPSDATSI